MPKIKFQGTGQEVEVKSGKSLKDITKENNWPVPYSCEQGVCGTCLIKIEKGMENLSSIEEQEKQTLDNMSLNDGSHRLACQCKVNGDVTISI